MSENAKTAAKSVCYALILGILIGSESGRPIREQLVVWNMIHLAGKTIGAVSGVLACAMWITALWAPDPSLPLTGPSFVTAIAMAFLAIFAVIASVKGHGVVLLVLFFASFFPVGVYLMGVPHWLRWVGVCNLGYLLAGLLLWRSGRHLPSEAPGT